MTLIIAFLTLILVLDCALLILLVLIQLPKKEAGIGVAFGGAATDALFGAGSGNALTKMTKYAASIFVLFSLLLSILNVHWTHQPTRILEQELLKRAGKPAAPRTAPAPAPLRSLPGAAQNPAQRTFVIPSNALSHLSNALPAVAPKLPPKK